MPIRVVIVFFIDNKLTELDADYWGYIPRVGDYLGLPPSRSYQGRRKVLITEVLHDLVEEDIVIRATTVGPTWER